ncbi:perforin-1-like [Tiliqua scincoides]|uniref:perforin-1-like n=1 Tax=Tiliqua scincoides TaxID=71010 RepID=UPI0034623417
MSPAASLACPTPSGIVTGLTLGPTPKEALSMGAGARRDLLLAPEKAPASKAAPVDGGPAWESYWADVDQWKATDGGCTLCENPLLEGKPLQRLPLIITDWKANISCQQKVQHSVQESVIAVAEALTELRVKNDWRNELDVKINLSAKIQFLRKCRQPITASQTHSYVSTQKFRLIKDPLLSDHFEHSIKNLPENYYPSSKVDYFKLIRTYGTHFGIEFDMGAHFRYLTAIPVCKTVLEDVSISELSLCLAVDVGIAFGFDGVTNSPDFQMCEEKKKNTDFFLLLSKMSEERWGGRFPSNTPKEWLESAKSMPALLSYSLEPLHNLVEKNNPRRAGLQQALSEYMRERALWRNCKKSCPPGSRLSTGNFCSCECPNNNFTNSMCCSQKRGLAKLTVTIERAEGLWGDFFSRSDGYVTVWFQFREMRTCTVWNNNNPTWNVTFDFGVIQLHENFTSLDLEVWDEDFGWNDNTLGGCSITLRPWRYEPQTCFLYFGCLASNGSPRTLSREDLLSNGRPRVGRSQLEEGPRAPTDKGEPGAASEPSAGQCWASTGQPRSSHGSADSQTAKLRNGRLTQSACAPDPGANPALLSESAGRLDRWLSSSAPQPASCSSSPPVSPPPCSWLSPPMGREDPVASTAALPHTSSPTGLRHRVPFSASQAATAPRSA